MGDFDACHSKLGSVGNTVNINGRIWHKYLHGYENVRFIGNSQPTLFRDERLDYVYLYGDPYGECIMEIVDFLLYDHFAVK